MSISEGGSTSRFPVVPVTISALGVVSWDELYRIDHYPPEASFSMMSERQSAPGGTTGNLAMTLSRLGASVSFFTKVCDDQQGTEILRVYREAGIDMSGTLVESGTTDLSVVLVSDLTSERTILWQKGPYLKRGDRIDIDRLFGADVVVLDPVDHELRRLLTDLPAHTRPRTRILGPLSYLNGAEATDQVEVALRHDVIVGNEREFQALTGAGDSDGALAKIQHSLTGTNCRLAIMTRGSAGSSAVDHANRWDCPAYPVNPVDTTGAGDAFAGAVAFGLAQRWDIRSMLEFASVVASRVVGTLGAQIGQPTLADVQQALDSHR